MTTNYKQLTDFLKFYNALQERFTGEPYKLNPEVFEALKSKFRK